MLVLCAMAVAACESSSAEDVICDKSVECLGATPDDVMMCRASVAAAPSGVASECATCVASHTCSEIQMECGAACGPISFEGAQTRLESAMEACDGLTRCGFDTDANCVRNAINSASTDAELEACATCINTTPCEQIGGACNAACT